MVYIEMGKYMTTLTIKPTQWFTLREHMVQEYGRSSLISWKLRDNWGLVAREHTDYSQKWNNGDTMWEGETIKLDFFDEMKQTMFLLKYSDYITQTSKG